jgi:hypothetical protein
MSSLLFRENLADLLCSPQSASSQADEMPAFFATRFWALLLAVGVIGLVLMVISSFLLSGISELLISEIGIAFVSAAIIGATVHLWMTDALRREVVKATLTAVLPPVFHTELLRLFDYDLLAETFSMLIEITTLEGTNAVRITVSIDRIIRNISTRKVSAHALAHLDDWGAKEGRAAVEECVIIDEERNEFRNTNPTPANEYSIRAITDDIDIKPNGAAVVRSKFSAVQRDNDQGIITFSMPISNPIVMITHGAELNHDFDFGRNLGPGEKEYRSSLMREYRLTGTYFPGFYMKVRWWPADWCVEGFTEGAKGSISLQ